MHSPELHRLLVQARVEDLRRVAAGDRRRARPARHRVAAPIESAVTLRFAFPDDRPSVARLADLDSSAHPTEPLLLAEVEGELRVALSLASGGVVADPFHATSELIELLRARARQLDGPAGARRSDRAWLPARLRGMRFRPRATLR